MIVATVGTQLGFDRLMRVVDEWAGEAGRGGDVWAQIGRGGFVPANVEWARFVGYDEMSSRLADCSLIVAHAGLGSIITALENAKPIIILPRLEGLGEHRNDHQVATAQAFSDWPGVHAVFDEDELRLRLDEHSGLTAPERISRVASPELLEAIREAILS